MKRAMLAVLGLFLVANLCFAQAWQTRVQRGAATQEMQSPGMSAAHSGIPVGSKVKITNPANGLEIEATITEQIPESYNRIIDLSPSAALALGIGSGGPVLVTTLTLPPVIGAIAPPPPPPPLPVPPPPPVAETEPETEEDQQQLPFNLIINNYVISPDQPLPQDLPPELAQGLAQGFPQGFPQGMVQDASQTAVPYWGVTGMAPALTAPAAVPAPVPVAPPAPVYAPAPAYAPPPMPPAPQSAVPLAYDSLFTAPPVANIQIIPNLPNPNTNKVYRLLVGTYHGVENSFRIYQQLQAAGFDVVQEQAGDMCRIYAAGIPASRVYYAAQRLGAIGFQQVWIHE